VLSSFCASFERSCGAGMTRPSPPPDERPWELVQMPRTQSSGLLGKIDEPTPGTAPPATSSAAPQYHLRGTIGHSAPLGRDQTPARARPVSASPLGCTLARVSSSDATKA